jgi:hypothetical protein
LVILSGHVIGLPTHARPVRLTTTRAIRSRDAAFMVAQEFVDGAGVGNSVLGVASLIPVK